MFIATILTLLGGGKIVARLIYLQTNGPEACEYLTLAGFRCHLLCISCSKVWEGPWITQRFGDCGYSGPTARAPVLSGQCGDLEGFRNLGTEPADRRPHRPAHPGGAGAEAPSAIVMTTGPFDLAHLKEPPPRSNVQERHWHPDL